MEKLGQINPLNFERSPLSEAARKKLSAQRKQTEKEAGYQQLAELCYLGEDEIAKRLAQQNPDWGYEIIDGVVTEKIE